MVSPNKELTWSKRHHHAFSGSNVLQAGLADPLEEFTCTNAPHMSPLHLTYACIHSKCTHR